MQKFFRISSPNQDSIPLQVTTIVNNPSFVSQNVIIQRPKTSQVKRHGHDEALQIFRVRPKLMSKEAFKNNQKKEDDINPPPPLNQNLFQQDQQIWDQVEQSDKGPRHDDKGNMLKYSLVGSVQAFVKEQQNHLGKTQRISIRIDNSDLESRRDLLDKTHDTQSRMKTGHSLVHNPKQPKKQRNKMYKEQILSPEEVDEQILTCKQHIKDAYFKSQDIKNAAYANLPKGERLYLNSFERASNKFGQTIENWQVQEQRFASRLGRSPENSIYKKSEQFRTVKEVRNLLEAITSDHEKYGDMAWQFGLRQPKSSIGLANPFKFAEQDGKGIQTDQKCPILEIIRKPQSSGMKSKYEGKPPYASFTSGKQYEAKLAEHDHQIHKLLLCNVQDVDKLEVRGHSVMNNEINSLITSPNTLFIKRVLKEEADDHLHVHPPEIVDVQWDRKQLLRQGKFGIAKTSFFIKE